MRKRSSTNSFKVLIGLFAIVIILAPFSIANSNHLTPDEMNDVLKGGNGSTVFSGDDVIDEGSVKSYPSAINLGYLWDKLVTGHYLNFIYSVVTGVASMPASEIVTGAVDNDGRVAEFEGPGFVSIENNSIVVHKPEGSLSGQLVPYTQAVKTESGVNIINNLTDEIITQVPADQISESTIDSFDNFSDVKAWYDAAKVGDKYNLQWGVAGCSDGRSIIPPDTLKSIPKAYDYAICHPPGDSIVFYTPSDTKYVEVSRAVTTLGSHPEYDDANRELNARHFVMAWNDTIIPAHSQGCGRSNVSFSPVAESSAASGSATHGVCPPARVLRSVAMDIGGPLPIGMTTGEDAVLFGYSPGTGIIVTNPLDHPVRIVMWTEGSGTGMSIYAAAEEMVPADVNVDASGNASAV